MALPTPIHRYIRDHTTHLFLTEDGNWTPDLAQAQSWPNFVTMQERCARQGLKHVDAVFQLEGDEYRVFPLKC